MMPDLDRSSATELVAHMEGPSEEEAPAAEFGRGWTDEQLAASTVRLGPAAARLAHVGAMKTITERRIPFEISADPFYHPANIAHLERVVADLDSGRVQPVRHDLIED